MLKLGPVWLHRVFSEKINYPWTLMSWHEREVPVNRPSGTPRPVLFPALGCRQPGGLPLPQIIKVTVKEIQLLLWYKLASRYRLRVVTIALRLDASFAAFTDQILQPVHTENYLLTLWKTRLFFFLNALWFLKGHYFWRMVPRLCPFILQLQGTLKVKMSLQHWWNETDSRKPNETQSYYKSSG